MREFREAVFGHVDLDWEKLVEVDPHYYRPTEVDYLLGDPFRAAEKLNWRSKTSFEDLVRTMVDGDIELLRETSSLVVSCASTGDQPSTTADERW